MRRTQYSERHQCSPYYLKKPKRGSMSRKRGTSNSDDSSLEQMKELQHPLPRDASFIQVAQLASKTQARPSQVPQHTISMM